MDPKLDGFAIKSDDLILRAAGAEIILEMDKIGKKMMPSSVGDDVQYVESHIGRGIVFSKLNLELRIG